MGRAGTGGTGVPNPVDETRFGAVAFGLPMVGQDGERCEATQREHLRHLPGGPEWRRPGLAMTGGMRRMLARVIARNMIRPGSARG
ncbi:hypothetical protein [Methylobacterium brachythecii]|uniref:hypothetical protein n=1 Tax=Methylobacterium brachythecii TaxID=1176177 RepID=UPI0024E0CAAF|nr:hypothetical protein [Methylobacterium brachythecii]